MQVLLHLFIPLLLLTSAHDVQVAMFKLHQEESKIVLDVTIETKDLIKELQITEQDITIELLKKYLSDNLEIQFDDKSAEVIINGYDRKAKHLNLQALIIGHEKKFQSIRIFNTCLLSIEDQSNIIEIRLRDQERDFLMNNERTSITIKFKD